MALDVTVKKRLMAVVLVGVVLGAEVGLALAVWRWVRRPRLGGVVVGAVLVLAVLATHLGHAWAYAARYGHHQDPAQPAGLPPADGQTAAAKTRTRHGVA